MGVIRGLADEGVRTPEHVSVVGFDNHPLSELWTPSLTTAHQDFFGLGQRGFELLMAQVSGAPGAKRFSSERPALVIRENAAAPSAARGRNDLTA
jgi:DNA-binding LacI/PurR family transcriptional regulator